MLDPDINKFKIMRKTITDTIPLDVKTDKKILGETELNFLMQKLKNSYNSLQKSIIENKNIIDKIKFEQKKYENIIAERGFKTKEVSPTDDITFFTNSSSEKIKLEKLQTLKKDYLFKENNEIDFAEILKNKLKDERHNLLYYTEYEIEIKEKLSKISFLNKNLNSNQNQNLRKSRNLDSISNDLNEKIQKTNNLIFMQTSKCEDLFGVLKSQKTELLICIYMYYNKFP